MSEVMGTILLTVVTIVLASGFALVVFQQFAGDTDTPAPSASFNLDARSGLPYVNVTLSEGSSFPYDEGEYRLTISGATVSTPYITNPLATGRFSPGDVLRFDLASGTVAAGSTLTFYAIDKETGEVIGHAFASVPLPSSLPLYMSNAPSSSGVSFSPSSVVADAATSTLITANVGSTYGLSLVTSVTADLTGVGGPSDYALNDEGLDGDVTAGDGIYSGQFTVATSALATGVPSATLTIPVNVEDIFGHTSSGGSGNLGVTAMSSYDLDDIYALIQNSTSVTNILGVGGISRNVPNSSVLYNLTITNFTWRDINELDNDVILYRISDMQDTTKTWVVAAYFSSCASGNGGGPYGAVTEVVWSRDGVAGYASWRPTSPTDCWTVDYNTVLNVGDLNRSINATGDSPVWTVTTSPSGSDPGIWSYANASIGTINQGIVPYFGDTQPTANPHGSVDDLGLGTAVISWSRGDVPTASFTTSRSGLTINVDGSASSATAGGSLTYSWDWGDGTTDGTGVTASHTYATAGTYTITLTVTTTAGTPASTSTSVTPNRAPTAAIGTTVTGSLTILASGASSTEPDGQTLTYTWMWGDGSKTTTVSTSASKTYATAGQYTITLFANDTLDGSGTATATIGQAPTASFTYTTAGFTAATNGSASSDPAGTTLSYAWTWGDGGTGTGATATYTYAANATHTVTLTVNNVFGTSGSTSQSVLHDGNQWLWCGPLSTTAGSITDCANLRSSTDSGASATISETNTGGRRPVLMTFNMTAYPEAGKTHTLQARAAQTSGTAETLALQVLDPTTGVWTTHATWSGAASISTATALTSNQWNNGAPSFRFTDANCITGTCAGSDNNAATWTVDWVRVVSS